MFEMNKHSPEILVVFLHPMIERLDVGLVEKAQNLLFQETPANQSRLC